MLKRKMLFLGQPVNLRWGIDIFGFMHIASARDTSTQLTNNFLTKHSASCANPLTLLLWVHVLAKQMWHRPVRATPSHHANMNLGPQPYTTNPISMSDATQDPIVILLCLYLSQPRRILVFTCKAGYVYILEMDISHCMFRLQGIRT